MTNDRQFDAFLAHNSKDKPQVKAISNKLKERNLKLWLDEDEIKGGDTLLDKIQTGLSQSKSIIFFIGSDGSGKWQGNLELPIIANLVINNNIRLIPVLLPGIKELPNDSRYYFLGTRLWIPFDNINDSNALDRLYRSIKEKFKEQKESEGQLDALLSSSSQAEIRRELINKVIDIFESIYDVPTSENLSVLHEDMKRYLANGKMLITRVVKRGKNASYLAYIEELIVTGKLTAFIQHLLNGDYSPILLDNMVSAVQLMNKLD